MQLIELDYELNQSEAVNFFYHKISELSAFFKLNLFNPLEP